MNVPLLICIILCCGHLASRLSDLIISCLACLEAGGVAMKWAVSSPNVTWKIVTVLSGRSKAQYHAIASTMPWSAASLAMSLFPADDAMPDDELWLSLADTPRSAARLALPLLLPENFRGHMTGGGDAILLGDQCNDEDTIAPHTSAASHLSIDSRVAAAPTPLYQHAAPLTEAARCGGDGRSASLVMKGQAGDEGTITECPSGTTATHTTASSAAADVHFAASGPFAAVVQPTAAVMGGNKQHFAPAAADTGKLLAALPMAADPAASALLFSVSADMRAAESMLVAGMLASAQPPILEAAAVAAAVSAAGADGLVLSGGPIDMALRNALEAAGISCAHRIRILSAMVSVRASERR